MSENSHINNSQLISLEDSSERSSDTHRVVVTQEDDACWIVGRGTTRVSVLVDDADGADLRRLRGGLDVSQVVTLSINHATSTQRTHWGDEQNVCNDCLTWRTEDFSVSFDFSCSLILSWYNVCWCAAVSPLFLLLLYYSIKLLHCYFTSVKTLHI